MKGEVARGDTTTLQGAVLAVATRDKQEVGKSGKVMVVGFSWKSFDLS